MKKCIITIGRQCGSGGHTIGKTVAERLGVPFYDKKLVQIVAERSGLSAETVRREGEYSSASSLFTSVSSRGYSAYNAGQRENMALPDQINAYQTELIKELADKGSCVIVGRCADYVLQDKFPCINIFIHAQLQKRMDRAVKVYGLAPDDVQSTLLRTDKRRETYYNYYTGRKFGDARNYTLSLDSLGVGIENAVRVVADYVEHWTGE